MRHGKKFNHLSRKKGHRDALLRSLSCALIEHKRINTTIAKAKALRVFIEPLITKSKANTTHSRRVVFSYLQSKDAVTELFDTVSAKVMERPGGYCRIIKTGFRQGDGAETAMIELVDFNETLLNAQSTKSKRRSRRGSKKTSTPAVADATVATVETASKGEEE